MFHQNWKSKGCAEEEKKGFLLLGSLPFYVLLRVRFPLSCEAELTGNRNGKRPRHLECREVSKKQRPIIPSDSNCSAAANRPEKKEDDKEEEKTRKKENMCTAC